MKKKSKLLNICFSVASFIILLIFVTNIITVLGWLIKIPISKYHLLLAFIATTILNYYLNQNTKQKFSSTAKIPVAYNTHNSKVENKRKFKNMAPTKVARPANNLLRLTVVPDILTILATSTERMAKVITPKNTAVSQRKDDFRSYCPNRENTSPTLPATTTLA